MEGDPQNIKVTLVWQQKEHSPAIAIAPIPFHLKTTRGAVGETPTQCNEILYLQFNDIPFRTRDHGLQILRVGRGNAGDFLATANERIHGTATDASSSAAPPGGSGGLLRMGRGSACALRLRGCPGCGIVELFRPLRANRRAAPSGFRRKVRARAVDSGSKKQATQWVVVAAWWVVGGGGFHWLRIQTQFQLAALRQVTVRTPEFSSLQCLPRVSCVPRKVLKSFEKVTLIEVRSSV